MRAEGRPEREETLPRREAARAALCRLDDLAREPWLPRGLADTLRHRYAHTLGHVPESLDPADLDRDHVAAHARLRGEVVRAQRLALIDLRDRGAIGDDALKRAERDLDLEELHTGIERSRGSARKRPDSETGWSREEGWLARLRHGRQPQPSGGKPRARLASDRRRPRQSWAAW